MELKVFRDVLPAAGAGRTPQAGPPPPAPLPISGYPPPGQRLVQCLAKPVGVPKQPAPRGGTPVGYLRRTVV